MTSKAADRAAAGASVGASVGGAFGGYGAPIGGAAGAVAGALSAAGASGVADPTAGVPAIDLVLDPAKRGGMSLAMAYRELFWSRPDAACRDDLLVRVGNCVGPAGVPGVTWSVEPACHGEGPWEWWNLPQFCTVGLTTLRDWRKQACTAKGEHVRPGEAPPEGVPMYGYGPELGEGFVVPRGGLQRGGMMAAYAQPSNWWVLAALGGVAAAVGGAVWYSKRRRRRRR